MAKFKSTATKGTANFSRDFATGDFVFREGELGTEMFIVQGGRVEVLKKLQGVEKQLAILEKGDFFGEMSLLEDLPRTASVRALEESKLIEINGATFDHMLRTKPEIAVRIMRKLSRRLREADKMLQSLGEAGAAAASAAATTFTPEVGPPPESPVVSDGVEKLIDKTLGFEYHLSDGVETLVGRRDPVTGINPGIDLTDSDTQRSTSRRHAKLIRDGEKFYVCEEIGTMNGTFVNGERVSTGVPVEVLVGDEVQFGLVKLVFDGGTG